jgi:VIT1/CCC1 family predicted Fe2+/Mn2+ transporter
VQSGRHRPDQREVTTGVLAAPTRAVSAAPPGGAPALATGRHLLLAALATLLTFATGLLGESAVTLAVTLNFLAVAVVLVLLTRAARRSNHPAGWRWYALSMAVGAGGALLAASVLP